jgi:hypothetical protein
MRISVRHRARSSHGTLFYDAEERREFLPKSKREVDWDERYVSEPHRVLFRQHR